jgi:hypothetical protein
MNAATRERLDAIPHYPKRGGAETLRIVATLPDTESVVYFVEECCVAFDALDAAEAVTGHPHTTRGCGWDYTVRCILQWYRQRRPLAPAYEPTTTAAAIPEYQFGVSR